MRKYYLNKRRCIIDNLIRVFLQISCVKKKIGLYYKIEGKFCTHGCGCSYKDTKIINKHWIKFGYKLGCS